MASAWLGRQLNAVAADSATWPAWKKREVDMPGFGETDVIQEMQKQDIEQQAEINSLKHQINELRAAVLGGDVNDDWSKMDQSFVIKEAVAARKEAYRLVMVANCMVESIGPDGVKRWLANIDRLIEEARATE